MRSQLLPLTRAVTRPPPARTRRIIGSKRLSRSGSPARQPTQLPLRPQARPGRRPDAPSVTQLMFFPEGTVRVHLYGRPVDMRKSFDGLHALARHDLKLDPTNGHLYVFITRRATQIKVLYWDRTGFCVWAKRLESGCFISDWSKLATRFPLPNRTSHLPCPAGVGDRSL